MRLITTCSHRQLMFVSCISLRKRKKILPSYFELLLVYWFIYLFSVLSLLWWFTTSWKQLLPILVIFLYLTCQRGARPACLVWYTVTFYCEPQFSGNAVLAILWLLLWYAFSLTLTNDNYIKIMWVYCYCSILISTTWLPLPFLYFSISQGSY